MLFALFFHLRNGFAITSVIKEIIDSPPIIENKISVEKPINEYNLQNGFADKSNHNKLFPFTQ